MFSNNGFSVDGNECLNYLSHFRGQLQMWNGFPQVTRAYEEHS
jgi:hypothetical protein